MIKVIPFHARRTRCPCAFLLISPSIAEACMYQQIYQIKQREILLDCMILYKCALSSFNLFWFFVLFLEIIHVAILHLESFS